MRFLPQLTISALSLSLFACDARSLTSPQVPPISLEAASGQAGPLVFLDGRRLLSVAGLKNIPASTIRMVEVLKAPAAVRLYGEEGRAGVIYIYTKAFHNQ